MRRAAAAKLALPALAILSGCDIFGPQSCTTQAFPGIVVEIRDAVTDLPVAEGTSGIVRDGTYEEDLAPHRYAEGFGLVSLAAAWERPGLYTVVLDHPEYELWVRDRVRVEEGECHVKTVTLFAELEPALFQ